MTSYEPLIRNIIYVDYGIPYMTTTQTQKLITITPKAAEKIKEFINQEAEKPEFLRVYVQGGGCSGLSYGMGFEKTTEEDDLVLEENGVKVLVDSYSQDHLRGANVDYIESLMGSGFKINNPNATKSCSCSHSSTTE
ncbi:MAG: iron-sulfur cluster assembly accessory protein (iscA, ISCA1) [Cenarchaeum symbiont of Oopsacas minuta]|nr:iron-sulfur cluster assembly accessory protein (iscA, ISCA1) [Cenarchaeum symbiont of Oopsacas minuta]